MQKANRCFKGALLPSTGEEGHGKSTQKKARRIMLQRLPAAEIFMHFLDMRLNPKRWGKSLHAMPRVHNPVADPPC